MSLFSRHLRLATRSMTQTLRRSARQVIQANSDNQISQPRKQSTSPPNKKLEARPRLSSSRSRPAGDQATSRSLGEGLATISKLAESLQVISRLEQLKADCVKQPKRRKGGSKGTSDRAVRNSTQKENHALFLASKLKGKMENDRDEKIQPSRQSGGVPEPTPQYRNIANARPNLLREAQHLLVVIDLNGTILYRPNKKQPTRFVARPHAVRFLQYCIDTFTVVIWSSARPENVKHLVEAIIPPELRQQVVAIWARDQFGLSAFDYNQRVQCYKRLTRLWEDDSIARSHPEYAVGRRWDQTNTVLVDDSYEKGRSEPYNIIEIPEFVGDLNETGDMLPQVHDCINQLSMHSNVSACLMAVPFQAKEQFQLLRGGYGLPYKCPWQTNSMPELS
ncbi:phosphoprotein phosphatase [Amylocarpus encephaloides]|uniref:Mitochondrial import inner membrane translocase subunit TIM50 n=1 Tax=Amylocarpus encephaloides TaxID=45428 RepID=A0A9P7YHQ8_9HELO|nr:phosphoprotein phosphatase [Amylocarpus encephaloides]